MAELNKYQPGVGALSFEGMVKLFDLDMRKIQLNLQSICEGVPTLYEYSKTIANLIEQAGKEESATLRMSAYFKFANAAVDTLMAAGDLWAAKKYNTALKEIDKNKTPHTQEIEMEITPTQPNSPSNTSSTNSNSVGHIHGETPNASNDREGRITGQTTGISKEAKEKAADKARRDAEFHLQTVRTALYNIGKVTTNLFEAMDRLSQATGKEKVAEINALKTRFEGMKEVLQQLVDLQKQINQILIQRQKELADIQTSINHSSRG